MNNSSSNLANDSEYRRRWMLFILSDGTIEDSREKNWREVAWERIDKIVVHVEGKEHVIEKHPKDHKFFIHFRQAGSEIINNNTNVVERLKTGQQRLVVEKEHKKIHIWTVGVTDGAVCFLVDIDFYTGSIVNTYTDKLSKYKNHIHPRIKDLIKEHKLCWVQGV